jgi:hypothetical protein
MRRVLVGKTVGKTSFGIPGHGLEYNIKMELK